MNDSVHRVETANLHVLTGEGWTGFFIRAIRAAKQQIKGSIYMVSPNWGRRSAFRINLLAELEAAAAKGLDCSIVLGSPQQSASQPRFNRSAAKQLHTAGWKIRIMPPTTMLHEKIWIFDNRLVIIGSHNLSVSSATTNLDTSIAVESNDLATTLNQQWLGRWNKAVPYHAEKTTDGESEKSDRAAIPRRRPIRRPTRHKTRLI